MDLISKKDLLVCTGISYGQLYRWKRQRLIPDEWFIKQASYTGQETFFPKEQIIDRVNSILELKDRNSLEELAELFSSETCEIALIGEEEVRRVCEIDRELLDLFLGYNAKEGYLFSEIVLLVVISKARKALGLSAEQACSMLLRGSAALQAHKSMDVSCVVFTADGAHHMAFVQGTTTFDDGINLELVILVADTVNQLKLNYKDLCKKKQG